MPTLDELVNYCDTRLRVREIADFPGSLNGLEVANSGRVTKIGATVDAGAVPFELAAKAGVNFLIVHHGLFWRDPQPIVGGRYTRLKTLFAADCAVYSAHLPLDLHPEIGNNALIAKALDLAVSGWDIPYHGAAVAAIVTQSPPRAELHSRLKKLFPQHLLALEFGPTQPRKIAILSGGGAGAISQLPAIGADTLITGELKEEHFNYAQENGLNLYLGGHYATEVFGVRALAEELAGKFKLPWEFLDTGCPL